MNNSNLAQHRPDDHIATSISANDYVAVTETEAAQILGISPKTLRNWRCLGKGPPSVKYGGRNGPVRYVVAEVVAWQQAHRRNRG